MYEVEIIPGYWIESDGSDLFDETENPLSDYDAEVLPENLGKWWLNDFTEPPKAVRRKVNAIERIENFYEIKNIDENGNVRFYNNKSISLNEFEKEYFWVSKEELSDFADYLEDL